VALGLVTLAHRFSLLAFAWDAQEYRRIRAVLQMGVDGSTATTSSGWWPPSASGRATHA